CMPSVIVVLLSQPPHPQGLYSAVDTGMTFFSLSSFILTFLPPSLAKPGTGAGAGDGRLNVYDAITSRVIHSRTFRARQGKGPLLGVCGLVNPTMFTIDANGQGGILLGDSVLNVFSESTIAITNSPLGIQVAHGLIASPLGVGTFVIENNGVGLNFALDGTAIFRGGLTGMHNGTGERAQKGAEGLCKREST